jgi:predicted amidophosphoribosyltransferase
VVARHVARQLGVPCRRLLERHGRRSPSQTGRTRAERLHGVAFRARPGLEGRRVLVVDDVVTTGATLQAARRALEEASVAEALLYAVAATPVSRSASRLPVSAPPAARHLRAVPAPQRASAA